MRKIKFRGQCMNGGWVYGSLVTTDSFIKSHTKTWIVTSAFGNGGWFSVKGRSYVKPETVGQVTGLHDKNGKEIYEGDVFTSTGKTKDGFNHVVVFSNSAFRSYCPDFDYNGSEYPILNQRMTDLRGDVVIGNIYENPELLNTENT